MTIPPHFLLSARKLGRKEPDQAGWLLQEIDFDLQAGSRWALLGPSGAGKTLLLRGLALLDACEVGQVLWHGQPVPVERIPHFRSRVLYLHQRPALIEKHVEDALRAPFALRVHQGRSFDRDRAWQWFIRLGREEGFLEKSVRELSGGEIQLTALVRALQLDPEVLLLDEPTAALDAATSQAVEDLLIEWVAQRPAERAWVWVSHNMEQAERVGEHRLRLEGGRRIA